MKVWTLLLELRRLGWDTEVVVSVGGVEHRVTQFKEGILGGHRAILVADPKPIPSPSGRKKP